RSQLQPQPFAGAGRGADLYAAAVADAGEERRLVLARCGLVVGPKQVGPGACAHRLFVVLEHEEEGRIGFEDLSAAADSRDADRRTFVDRSVISLAPPQRLRDLCAADELADLDTRSHQHRHFIVLEPARSDLRRLDDAHRLAAGYHRLLDYRVTVGRQLDCKAMVVLA